MEAPRLSSACHHCDIIINCSALKAHVLYKIITEFLPRPLLKRSFHPELAIHSTPKLPPNTLRGLYKGADFVQILNTV